YNIFLYCLYYFYLESVIFDYIKKLADLDPNRVLILQAEQPPFIGEASLLGQPLHLLSHSKVLSIYFYGCGKRNNQNEYKRERTKDRTKTDFINEIRR
ncbi:hypothetical protein ACFWDG_15140, partial [Peribacillus sp. NPDC060186]